MASSGSKSADAYIRHFDSMRSRRSIWEGHWREIAERVRPNHNLFQQVIRPAGDKRNERIFDETAMLALPKFAAAVISMAMPATQLWHKLAPANKRLKDDRQVKRYLEDVNDILFMARYAPRAAFQSNLGEVVLDIGAFGTGLLFIDDDIGRGLHYRSMPLSECYIAEDGMGQIDTVIRKWDWTHHQAVTFFGLDVLPENIRKAYETDPEGKSAYLHCVKPNTGRSMERMDYSGMPFESCYLSYDERHIISQGGYKTFPYAVGRFETAPRETYGRSPAMKVLPAIKSLNEMEKTILRAAEKIVDPPLMLTDDGSLAPFNLRSGALNFGYIDSNGRPLAQPLQTGGRVDIGEHLQDKKRDAINDAFFVTLFRILVEEPQITATEAMLRAQEKGQLLAPTMGRIQTEIAGPMIEREIQILADYGALPPMPDQLIASGGEFMIEYQSPLNQAQRASIGVGIMNTIQAVAPLAQLDPTVMQIFDPVAITRELADINGVPEKVIRDDGVLAALAAKAQQSQQVSGLLQAAPIAAQTAKDFAQAQSLAGSAPNQQAPALFGS